MKTGKTGVTWGGAYDFTLEDNTATIGISVPCSCFGETSIADGQTIIAIVSIRENVEVSLP